MNKNVKISQFKKVIFYRSFKDIFRFIPDTSHSRFQISISVPVAPIRFPIGRDALRNAPFFNSMMSVNAGASGPICRNVRSCSKPIPPRFSLFSNIVIRKYFPDNHYFGEQRPDPSPNGRVCPRLLLFYWFIAFGTRWEISR